MDRARKKQDHDWQQSEGELEYIIDKFTEERATIIDPFAGSGTVLSMAHKMGRHAIGYELEKHNVEAIKARLRELGFVTK